MTLYKSAYCEPCHLFQALPSMTTPQTLPDTLRIDLGIHGMTCASCVGRAERALEKSTRRAGSQRQSGHRVGPRDGACRLSRSRRGSDAPCVMPVTSRWLPMPPLMRRHESTWAGFATGGHWVWRCHCRLMLPMLGGLWGQHWMLPAWVQFVAGHTGAVYFGCALLQGGLAFPEVAQRQHGFAGGHGHHGGLGAVGLAVAECRARGHAAPVF